MKGQEVRDIVKAIASGQQIPPEKETPHLTEITRRSAVALGEHMSGIKEHSGDETFYAKMLHDHFVL
ncbi:hypothetical protein KKE45_02825 [Patescibacteria group bacterium]|nr:hypothetical protein [Patescibacteria group bacterium]